MLENFDTNYKVNPPLREKADQDALMKGLKDGTIDVLVSNHCPHEDESKFLEFDQADFGLINLQTFASQLVSLSKSIEIEILLEKVTDAPRKLLKRQPVIVDVSTKANLTLLDPNFEWTFVKENNFSKSKNSPWLGNTLKGKVVAVFNNGKQWLDV